MDEDTVGAIGAPFVVMVATDLIRSQADELALDDIDCILDDLARWQPAPRERLIAKVRVDATAIRTWADSVLALLDAAEVNS
jgi:hypothetical protein